MIPGLIPEPLASVGSARAICGAVQWDHSTPVAVLIKLGPEVYNRPQNLTPMTKAAHLEKTRKDVARIYKGRRLEASTAEHRQARAVAVGQAVEPEPVMHITRGKHKKPWGSRPMPFGRNSDRKRKMSGEVVPRENRRLH